jgi:hypothetical protein
MEVHDLEDKLPPAAKNTHVGFIQRNSSDDPPIVFDLRQRGAPNQRPHLAGVRPSQTPHVLVLVQRMDRGASKPS